MPIALPHLLILLVAVQGIVLAGVFLFVPYFKSRANQQLALTFTAVGISCFNYALIESGFDNKWLILCNDIMWEYLFPASLLLYFIYALDHPAAQKKERYYFYLPFLITLVINVWIDLDVDFELYQISLFDDDSFLKIYYAIEEIGVFVFAIGVCIYAYRIVNNATPKIKTRWFKQFWWWATSVILFWMVLWLLFEVMRVDVIGIVYAAVMLLFSWVTYQGVLRFKLAEEKFEIRQILADQPPAKVAVQPHTSDNPHFRRLERLMQEEHLYRDPDLSRDSVAQKLGISNGYLSQQLSKEGTSFSAYINQYRVESVKQLLVTPDFHQYSLLAIGYEAGFNSKSTFYAAFKKSTGISPSAYREKMQKAS